MKLSRMAFIKLVVYISKISNAEYNDHQLEKLEDMIDVKLPLNDLGNIMHHIEQGNVNAAISAVVDATGVQVKEAEKFIRSRLPKPTNRDIVIKDCMRFLVANNMQDAAKSLENV